MLYFLVRPIARYVLAYYFRRIDITGLEHIPPNAAVILAANHPTAFLEPCILACFQRRPLHFLVRGDLYKHKLASWVLRALRMLPVYRIQDGGYGQLNRNYETFDDCYTVLSKQQALMILAEGRCIHEKRLRPLRKGTARIALGALDRDTALHEVYIVPVGVNFVAAERLRTTVMIRCGTPIQASSFLAEYRHNEASGLRELTDQLRRRLEKLVIRIPDRQVDDAYESRLELARNDLHLHGTGLSHSGRQLDAELAVASAPLNDEPGILRYAARLQQHGITDADLVQGKSRKAMPWAFLPALLLLLPQLPLWGLAELIALRGPKTVEFYSPVRFAAIAVGTLLYLPLLLLLPWAGKVWLLLSLLLTNWSLRQVESFLNWRGAERAAKLVPAERELLLDLRRRVR